MAYIIFLLFVLVAASGVALVWTAGTALSMLSGAPYVPTPKAIARIMCSVGDVKKGDRVLDLGCGDAAILIEATKEWGATGVGVELNVFVSWLARFRAWRRGLKSRIQIVRGNIFKVDLPDTDLIFLYLLPRATQRISKRLQERYKHMRVVSHGFEIKNLQPIEVRKSGRAVVRLYEW